MDCTFLFLNKKKGAAYSRASDLSSGMVPCLIAGICSLGQLRRVCYRGACPFSLGGIIAPIGPVVQTHPAVKPTVTTSPLHHHYTTNMSFAVDCY